MEQRRLRGIEIFRFGVLGERAGAEADHAVLQIHDRKHHALAEAVERQGNILAGDEQAGLDHVLDRHALAAEIFLEREALRRRVAQAKARLRRRRDGAVGEIAARAGAGARLQALFEELGGELHHFVERLAARLALLLLGRGRRHRHSGETGQPLHRLAEREPFGLH